MLLPWHHLGEPKSGGRGEGGGLESSVSCWATHAREPRKSVHISEQVRKEEILWKQHGESVQKWSGYSEEVQWAAVIRIWDRVNALLSTGATAMCPASALA